MESDTFTSSVWNSLQSTLRHPDTIRRCWDVLWSWRRLWMFKRTYLLT